MKFIFVDAENTGAKELENINATVSDKVMVFSKNESIKEISESKLFLTLSSYPSGPNQADFYIIGNLVGLIASLTQQQKEASHFFLHSSDNSLICAFKFQCSLHKVKYAVVSSKESPIKKVPTAQKPSQTLEEKLYEQFKTARTAEDARKKLNHPKPEFTRAMNSLIQQNKIKRHSNNKKTWIKAA